MAEKRISPYTWQYNGAQFEDELRLPVYSGSSAPDMGAGSKRWNPATSQEETWNGTEWVATGSGVGGDYTYDNTGFDI